MLKIAQMVVVRGILVVTVSQIVIFMIIKLTKQTVVPSSAPWRHFFLRYINSFNEGGSFGNVEGPQPTPESLVAKSLQGTPSSQSSNL